MTSFFQSAYQLENSEKLWAHTANYCKDNFQWEKLAIISLLPQALPPYKIHYLDGFAAESIEEILTTADISLSDDPGQHAFISAASLPANSPLQQILSKLEANLLMQLSSKDDSRLLFFIKDNRDLSMPEKQGQLENFFTDLQLVLNNIAFREESARDYASESLKPVMSQIAHDFESFISLTLRQFQSNNQLLASIDLTEAGSNGDNIKMMQTKIALQQDKNERLIQSATEMEKQVESILAYFRPKDLKFTMINLNQLLDLALDSTDFSADTQIEKNYEIDLPKLRIDFYQMQVVLTKLLENSILAMQQKPEKHLQISTRMLQPETSLSDICWAQIEIADSGAGIPEEYQPRIFNPFFTSRKHEGGSGMGLAIARQIIEGHDGYIDLSSTSENGSTFIIRLPILTV